MPSAIQLSTERKIQGGFAFALVCLGLIGVVSWLAVQRLRADAAWIEHTHAVIHRLESLLTAASEAQGAQRGYLISGNESFMQPFHEAMAQTLEEQQKLRELTGDNPAQRQRLEAIGIAIRERLALSTALMETRRTRGLDAAVASVPPGTGLRLQARIRSLVDDMVGAERSLLEAREKEAGRSTRMTQAVILAGGALALIFVGFATFAVNRDFAGRRRAERALQEANEKLEQRVRERTLELTESERLLQETGELAQVGGWDFDPVTGEGRWTEEVARIHDLDPGVVTNKDFGLQFYPGESRARIEAAVKAAVEQGTPYDLELQFVSAKGVPKWVRTIGHPVTENGRVVKVRGAFQDVTHRKQVEAKMRGQLSRMGLLSQITRAIGERQDMRSIFQVVVRTLEAEMPLDFACICLYDPLLNELTVNSIGVRSEALAMSLAMTQEARVPVDRNGLSQCVQGKLVYEPDVRQMAFPFPQRLAGGGLRAMVAAPLVVESQVFGVLVAARTEADSFSSPDCEFLRQLSQHVALAAHQAQLHQALQKAYDELRQTQQAVMQQERLRALGQMASGIAHDINNAISPVTLYTEALLEQEKDLSPRTRSYLETIQRAIEDVAHTVSRMREFYRPREPQLTLASVDLNRAVKQVIDLTRARWCDMVQQRGANIEMRVDLAPDLPLILGAESEVREALTNLIFNAVDAMPAGGKLTLRSSAAGGTPSKRVYLEVIDTGIGMDEDTRRRCLEPFFTTKGERGTGLGLAMVYGVMQRHSATLDIESEVGKGTTVRLSFPAQYTPVEAAQTVVLEKTTGLRILIVDDDPLLLQSLRNTLEADGHHLTTGDGGQAGIDAFQAAQGQKAFDVVITDLGMPYVDGRKVAAAIKAMDPAMPVILLTGWGQRMKSEGDIPPGVDKLLSKPPKLNELRAALSELTAARKG